MTLIAHLSLAQRACNSFRVTLQRSIARRLAHSATTQLAVTALTFRVGRCHSSCRGPLRVASVYQPATTTINVRQVQSATAKSISVPPRHKAVVRVLGQNVTRVRPILARTVSVSILANQTGAYAAAIVVAVLSLNAVMIAATRVFAPGF